MRDDEWSQPGYPCFYCRLCDKTADEKHVSCKYHKKRHQDAWCFPRKWHPIPERLEAPATATPSPPAAPLPVEDVLPEEAGRAEAVPEAASWESSADMAELKRMLQDLRQRVTALQADVQELKAILQAHGGQASLAQEPPETASGGSGTSASEWVVPPAADPQDTAGPVLRPGEAVNGGGWYHHQ